MSWKRPPSVLDRRVAEADVIGEPDLLTASGKYPIAPQWIRVTYDIPTGTVASVLVVGPRTDLDYPRTVRRMVVTEGNPYLPEWVTEFVEHCRPGVEDGS